jgi:uncharacterized protein YjcR
MNNETATAEPVVKAKHLYWQGLAIAQIAELLNQPLKTVYAWKYRNNWDDSTPLERVESALETRLVGLVLKEKKEAHGFKEIDLLGRQLERTAKVRKYQETGKASDLNPELAERMAEGKRKAVKNEFSPEQAVRLQEAFGEWMFAYQRTWYEAGLIHRIRNVLKARRIGGTRFFSREGLCDALKTGRSQIWLSASKAQAHEAKRAMIDFARSAAEVELKGDPIVLPARACTQRPDEDPSLYFLGTNVLTAQGYGGNFIFDEYFWVHKFGVLRKVASGMALHRRFRHTYLSSPSAMLHEAYPFWTGAHFNRGRAKANHISLDVTHAALKAGRLCEDGQWRQIVTIEDAIEGGCDLFDIEQLKMEYSAEEFAQLLMCEFIDDGKSVFSFASMQACMVDSWEVWEDFKPFALRPLGSREVWIGYDPSSTGDSAALVVVAPPLVAGGKFRLLEKMQFWGMDYESQAQAIKEVTERYNVTFIGIDTSGIGSAVVQLVSKWYPNVTSYDYSVSVKTRMVLKALAVIGKGRLEFDAGWSDVSASFMAIRKTMTNSGRQVTFEAGRAESISHADLAWATLHALAHEPLESDGGDISTGGFMVLS